jgi:nicotinamide mononucleotide (NMN) deamidase PncC
MLPKGVEEGVMFAVAPVVDTDRGGGRSADRWVDEASAVGLDGAGGEDGEGEARGLSKAPASESTSTSGVVGPDAMAMRGGGKEGGCGCRGLVGYCTAAILRSGREAVEVIVIGGARGEDMETRCSDCSAERLRAAMSRRIRRVAEVCGCGLWVVHLARDVGSSDVMRQGTKKFSVQE